MIPDLISHLEAHPDDAETWVLLAAARFETDSPKAERTLNKALQLQPDLAIAWAERGRWMMRKGEWDKAESILGQALALNGSQPDILSYRGICRRRLGRHQLAKEDFEAAITISPYQTEAEWHLRMYQEQEEARATGSWVTIEVHFDPEWLFLMKNLLLDEGIPTRISQQEKEFALSSSTRSYGRKLQVPLESSEQAYWAVYEWAMNHHYYQFADREREEDAEENIDTAGSKVIPVIGFGILLACLIGLLLVLLLSA